MNTFAHVPPGFRFHPTDEELVDYYLRKKVNSRMIDLDVVKDVDLYKIEPWDLQEICRLGTEEQNEWYFFSHKDKKYPTGTRTNRATAAGFWKATGRDKAIYSKHDLIGMRKTLVFYKGRAPNGQKSDWIMHEYRLQTDENGTTQEEGWVVCRVFKKRTPTMHKLMSEHESSCWYEDQVSSFMQDLDSPKPRNSVLPNNNNNNNNPCKKELDLPYHYHHVPHLLHQLPLLDTPKVNFQSAYDEEAQVHQQQNTNQQNFQVMYNNNNGNEEMTDWRVLDKLVASQLSQEDASKPMSFDLVLLDSSPELKNASLNLSWSQINREKEDASKDNSYSSANLQFRDLDKEKILVVPDENNASTSTSSCPIDLWK